MREIEFRDWIVRQGHSVSTQSTQVADAKRIERHYGDLDDAYDVDGLEAIRTALAYTKEDERAGRENPARFTIDGNLYANLSHFRSTLKYYADFRAAEGAATADSGSADKRITLFDDNGTAHWPVQQTNRSSGTTAFRIKGASNRTEDAIETSDIIEVARALFKEGRAVRVLRSNNGRVPYLSYGRQKLTAYQVTPEIAVELGIPEQGSVNGEGLPKYPTIDLDDDRHAIEAKQGMAFPTNLILYGPPGTGKTFRTSSEAVRLCDGDAPINQMAVKARYDQLVEAGQIAFVTFHQSYAYEDFVEGLRPVTSGDDENEAGNSAGFRLEPRRGVFREISALAEQARRNAGRASGFDLSGRQFFKMSLGRAGSEDHIYDAAIEGGYIVLGWGGEVNWSNPEFESWQAIFDKWNQIEPGTSGNSGSIAQVWRFRSSMKKGDIVIVSDGNSRFRAIGEIAGPYEYNPTGEQTYNHRRAVNWLLVLDESLPVESIHDGKFTQQSCYLLKASRMKHEALARLVPGKKTPVDSRPDQFVLIIDEINRANISKVFGELITLVEADKRLGEDNAITLKLPYSGEAFGVPNNLHILGTMNTADRSIALLDTALRRRFTFRELMPEPALLADASARTGVDLAALLTTINDRIEYLFDREHQIGHAYFIHCRTVADVHDVMRFRIIPLLAEYFYEDWSKVALVLGDGGGAGNFIKRVKLAAPAGLQADAFDEERYRWDVCAQFVDGAYDQFE